ncbi:hypothetical protein BH18THE2_BH18THE2_20970 [soil metagenome]
MIPRTLPEWNCDKVKELTDKGYLEADTFEFKFEIKSRDPKINERIIQTSCAFANTDGGFIIFGVADLGNKNEDRIVGLRNLMI